MQVCHPLIGRMKPQVQRGGPAGYPIRTFLPCSVFVRCRNQPLSYSLRPS
jgi:hypothetical protein